MNMLTSLYKNYTCLSNAIKIGEEYKVYDLERDPFYGQMPEEYRKIAALQGSESFNFATQLYYELDKIAYYFIGEYKEVNDDEFSDIFPEFFKEWYFGQVYVCYSEEMLKIEVESWKDRKDINRYKSHYKNPYRLFRLSKRINETTAIYSSIFTGIHYEIDEKKIPMVWASANGGMFYIWWREILKNWIGGLQKFFISTNLLIKRVLRHKYNPDTAKVENESLNNLSAIFDVDRIENLTGDYNNYDKFDIMPPEVPKAILDTVCQYLDTEGSKLGYTQNMNDKKERLTTGENYKDLHGITNVQGLLLSWLDKFARQFKEEYPEKDLKFQLSNMSDAEGIPYMFNSEEINEVEQDKPEKEKQES